MQVPDGVSVTTAAPDILNVTLTTAFHAQPHDPSSTAETEGWELSGTAVTAVYLTARSYDELPKQPDGSYPLSMQYTYHLQLRDPLAEGQRYHLQTPFGAIDFRFSATETVCDSIKVNQVGYHPENSKRFAVLGAYLGTGGTRKFGASPGYRVVHAETEEILHMGTALYAGDDSAVSETEVTSGEHVYHLDLGPVPQGGPYVVVIDGFGRSLPFSIGYAAVNTIFSTYMQGLYYQRCGMEFPVDSLLPGQAACHTGIYDTRVPWSPDGFIEPAGTEQLLHVTGGYHDAGDFDRRPQHVIIPVLLLSCYEAFPDHFFDGQLPIAEAGNGLPDILDEALWGLSFWEAMQITDEDDEKLGAVRAGTETARHPEYGVHTSATDPYLYGTWDTDPETTAFSAGMLAQAARLLQPFSAYSRRAQLLLRRAELAWDYLEENGYSSEATAGNLYAALQLHLAGKSAGHSAESARYHERFSSHAEALLLEDGYWPQQYRPGNIYAACQSVHFMSYLIGDDPTDSELAAALTDILLQQAARGGYMGIDRSTMRYPQGATKGYGWGAATAQGRYAELYLYAGLITEDSSDSKRYFNLAASLGDYALGLNPLGISYVTGLGTRGIQSPLHLDSHGIGSTIPGIVVFGPSAKRSAIPYQRVVSDTLIPSWDELPLQRRWADGWSLVNSNEFSVWETTVWNAFMCGALLPPVTD